jgi:hypothetical protein
MGSATYDCDIATCFYGGTFDLKWGTIKAELTFNKEDQTKEKGFFSAGRRHSPRFDAFSGSDSN